MGDQDALREQVESSLPVLSVQELEGVCTEIDLNVPDDMKGKKSALYRHLLTHLWSEGDKEDQGFATFKIVQNYLAQLEKKMVGVDVKPKILVGTVEVPEVQGNKEVNPGDGGDGPKVSLKSGSDKSVVGAKSSLKSRGSGVVEVQRLQAFKITGVIGGETNNITFDNLNFQINNALEAGYSEPSICGAVIKAICPSNQLRIYFETETKLDVTSMLDILRPYLVQNKDGASYYADLCSAKERPPDKTAMDFVVRLLGLKNRIFKLSEEEGTPFDANLMKKQFYKTLFSGLKNMNIRAEIRESCKSLSGRDIPDKELLRIVAEAMGNEALRAGNFSTSKEVNSVEYGTSVENEVSKSLLQKGKNKENLLPAQVDKQKQEINVLRAEVNELRGQNNEIKSLLVANNKLLTAQAQVNSASATPAFSPFGGGNSQGFSGGQPPQNGNINNNNKKAKNWPKKCPACHQNNVYRCNHCWDCGSNSHKKGDPSCPENQ